MASFFVAHLPQRVRGCVAARKRGHPREHQPAFDDTSLREAALAAVDLVEVQRMRVASQDRQLHMLAFADSVTDAVKNHIADFKVFEQASRSPGPTWNLALPGEFQGKRAWEHRLQSVPSDAFRR